MTSQPADAATRAVDGHLPRAAEEAHARRMARVDGCPECVLNVEEPRIVSAAADGFSAEYECSDCGHRWTTSWKDE